MTTTERARELCSHCGKPVGDTYTFSYGVPGEQRTFACNRPSCLVQRGIIDVEDLSDAALHDRFAAAASHIRTLAETVLLEHFGERCDDFEFESESECDCCKRWRALDDLIDNPY